MKAKHSRLLLLLGSLLLLIGAAAFVLKALEQSILYFHSPTDLLQAEKLIEPVNTEEKLRLGGVVADDSYHFTGTNQTHSFIITDGTHSINVIYQGLLPDLFREGQGVVADGALLSATTFQATRLLAKHDEEYMPPEVKRALEKGGYNAKTY